MTSQTSIKNSCANVYEGCDVKILLESNVTHEGRVYQIDKLNEKLTLFGSNLTDLNTFKIRVKIIYCT